MLCVLVNVMCVGYVAACAVMESQDWERKTCAKEIVIGSSRASMPARHAQAVRTQ